MRLVWHLAKHDLRATRLLAASWLVVVLLGFTHLTLGPVSGVSGYRTDEFVSLLLEFSRLFGVALLATVIVQRDPLDDPCAFWRTRPIPRVVLWLSKMVATAGLTALLPALLLAAALWSVGVAGGAAPRLGADLAVDHLAVAAAALLIAVPTRSVAQAISGAFAAAAAIALLVGALETLRPLHLGLWPEPSGAQLATVGMLAAAAITATHYLSLRRRLAMSLSAVVTALLIVVPSFAVDVPVARTDEALTPSASDVSVTLGPDVSWRKASPGEDDEDRFSTSVRVDSTALDAYFMPTDVTGVLRLATRSVAVGRADIDTTRTARTPATSDDVPYRSMRTLVGARTLMVPPGELAVSPAWLVLPVTRAVAGEMEAGEAHLSAALLLEEHRLEALALVPATTGATVNTRAGRLRIAGMHALPGELAVDVSWIGTVPWNHSYVLVSADGQRAVVGRTGIPPGTPDGASSFSRVSTAGWRLSLTSIRERLVFALPAAGVQPVDGAWRGATVHVITGSDVGRRRVEIEVDGIGRVP